MSTFFNDPQPETTDIGTDESSVADDGTQPLTPEPAPAPCRPTGPSWSTIAFGLICLVVASGALLIEFTELTLEWDRTGPVALMALGGLLVLVGLAALMRRGDGTDTA